VRSVFSFEHQMEGDDGVEGQQQAPASGSLGE
jgi:hypothetical protein